ncbi:MAG TPA: response regulator [Mucilaginibacter sp.]|jgi:CheY-like chemotaxis protein
MIKRIFVLDDNQDILEFMKEALIYEKFEVSITSNCDNVIEAIQNYQPNLIILDYKLNGADGDAICNQIKIHPQLCDIPVIICSAYINKNSQPLNCGCEGFIAKPFGLEELLDKVNRLTMAN